MAIVDNPTVIAIVTTFIILYTSTLGPEPPELLVSALNNTVFRFVIVFCIAYLGSSRRPIIALAATVLFLTALSLVAQRNVRDRIRS
ncbi:g749 [Coccomyxa elongata]